MYFWHFCLQKSYNYYTLNKCFLIYKVDIITVILQDCFGNRLYNVCYCLTHH